MAAEYFISRTGNDKAWAEWIANELHREGFTTFVQDRDFVPGKSFIENMQIGAECPCTIAVISPDYWESPFTNEEWRAALGSRKKLLLVRVKRCDIPSLLAHRVYLDF